MRENIWTGAVDIGGTKIQIGLVDRAGRILQEKTFQTNAGRQSPQKAMENIDRTLRKQCAAIGVDYKALQGIGVSCAGPVDAQKGIVENPYTLPGWEGFPLVEDLSARSGLPVRLENDANGALLGEILQRGLWDQKVLMVTFGTGIGVAFWNGRAVYRSGRFHPEMGHIIVASGGDACYCGHRGCFESRCSGQALNRRAAQTGYTDFDALYAAAVADGPAAQLLEEICRDIQNGIWSLSVIFKPQCIVLGGGFTKRYFQMLRDATLRDSAGKGDFLEEFSVLPALENRNSALVGAVMLFKEENQDEEV